MIFVTSDPHGYPLDRFMELLEKARFSEADRLYVIGDVIDRNGDGGVAMLRWIMARENVTLLMGNHEDMLLNCDFLFTTDAELTDRRKLSLEQEHNLLRWHRNGAMVTIENLMDLKREDPAALAALLDDVRKAPLYMEIAIPGKRFVLVHGGLGGFSPDKGLDEYDRDDLIWTRPDPEDRYWDDRLVILGHTPTWYYKKADRMFKTKTWIDIDTGAAGGGSPMLLRLDDMKAFYADS